MSVPFSQRGMDRGFINKVSSISGEPFRACMQCGTCSSVCPMQPSMVFTPRRTMLMTQWGQRDMLLEANTPWICASCHACEVRCPRGIDIPRVMESLRQLILRENENYVRPESIEKERIAEMPQMALVSAFRKHTA